MHPGVMNEEECDRQVDHNNCTGPTRGKSEADQNRADRVGSHRKYHAEMAPDADGIAEAVVDLRKIGSLFPTMVQEQR